MPVDRPPQVRHGEFSDGIMSPRLP